MRSKIRSIAGAYSESKVAFMPQTYATIVSIIMAVLAPQIAHVLGRAFGVEKAIGEIILPMHFPVILVGVLAGPYAGLITGLMGPLASSLLIGMPAMVKLPFMMIELGVYGLVAGLIRNTRLNMVLKVLIAQLAGRVIRALAIIIAVSGFGNPNLEIAAIIPGYVKGIIGIALELALIPLIMWGINKAADER